GFCWRCGRFPPRWHNNRSRFRIVVEVWWGRWWLVADWRSRGGLGRGDFGRSRRRDKGRVKFILIKGGWWRRHVCVAVFVAMSLPMAFANRLGSCAAWGRNGRCCGCMQRVGVLGNLQVGVYSIDNQVEIFALELYLARNQHHLVYGHA